ncbi:ER membrane protein complex subunit 7 [Grifola frondosa]|uniref:ER membrane protein complex subunit 7 n=1 Tax=Grifola frondosa TaxID=5627 RepID=A0A1C7MQT9_GRIFR|nr:ER membrane protein complex subunit 7 [Grifola frondosa]
MRVPLALLALTSSCYSALALDLKGRIQWNDLCPGIGDLGQAKVLLDNGKLYGGVTRDGGFVIPDVPAGTYVLSVQTHDYAFEKVRAGVHFSTDIIAHKAVKLRIDVFEEESLPEVRPYFPGTPLFTPSTVTLPYPIVLAARQKNDYFVPHESFNIVGMFKNPMMMMMLGVGAMALLMPYIMKNMDPEVLEDFKERQARVSTIQSSLQSGDLASSFSALLNGGSEDAKSSSSSPAKQPSNSSGVKHRGGKNKKR